MYIKKLLLTLILIISAHSLEFNGWKDLLRFILKLAPFPKPHAGEFPYFNCLPHFKTYLKEGAYSTNSTCFQKIDFTATYNDQETTITVKGSNKKSYMCSDTLLITTLDQTELVELFLPFKQTFTFKSEIDVKTRGVSIFDFEQPLSTLTRNLVATAELFLPFLYKDIPEKFQAVNLDFLNKYMGVQINERKTNHVTIPVEEIRSGDTFHIRRLDGLDPMISWAMGGATGHMTIAVERDGIMQVCESQVSGDYWPINGIQCNKYEEWIRMAQEANYTFVWAPIRRSLEFDLDGANKFIDKMLGVDYGWHIILTMWIDTLKDNYPCRRGPEFPREQWGICFEPEFAEVVFTNMERISKDMSNIIDQALNQRVGTKNKSVSEVYKIAIEKGWDTRLLPSIPEQDDWVYSTTRNGEPYESPEMVCHEFVCQVFKAAGVYKSAGYEDVFNCNEFSLFDVYKLDIFEKEFSRPQQCIDADPENPLCQLGGKYELRLDTFRPNQQNYNFVTPRNGMAENCPSLGPYYIAEDTC